MNYIELSWSKVKFMVLWALTGLCKDWNVTRTNVCIYKIKVLEGPSHEACDHMPKFEPHKLMSGSKEEIAIT